MKQLHGLAVGVVLASSAVIGRVVDGQSADAHVSYHFKERQSLRLEGMRLAFSVEPGTPESVVIAAIRRVGVDPATVKDSALTGWRTGEVVAASRSVDDAVETLAAQPGIAAASPVFQGFDGLAFWPTPNIVVGFRPEATMAEREAILRATGAESWEYRWHIMPDVAYVRLKVRDGSAVIEIANALAVRGEVAFAESDMIGTGRHQLIPNDSLFGQLWGLHNTGQSNGLVDFDMDAAEAWDITTGAATVITMVMDVGVQQGHPDINSGPGNDFTGGGTAGDPGNECDNHGTAVVACISGRINNALGIAGVAPSTRTSSARIGVSTRPCNGTFMAPMSWFVDALNWGASIGARVTNNSNSWGFASASLETAYERTFSEFNMVHFASAGNDRAGTIAYPSSIPVVNSVAATERTGGRASFSQFGIGLDFSAPGDSIVTADRTGAAGYGGGDYVTENGTSYASPYAAGVAALVISINPSLSAADVVSIMQNSCVDLGVSGYDTAFGWGHVNARAAVDLAQQSLGTFVDFSYVGPENGSRSRPFNTLAEGMSATPCGGRISLVGGRSAVQRATFSRPTGCPVTIYSISGDTILR
jgi:subtilisin family serine protease